MMRRPVVLAATFLLAAALLLGGVLGLMRAGSTGAAAPSTTEAAADKPVVDATGTGMTTLQAQLRRTPDNWSAWAALGSRYVQQGRITADPTYYPRAQAAFERSLRLQTRDNFSAMAGMGALAAARHDFAAALSWSQRAIRINAYDANGYGVAGDALVELGRYPEAFRAFQRMADLRPGLSSFARASYAWELRGDIAQARAALERALRAASTPADVAFGRYYLGELAWSTGDLVAASEQYAAGLVADPLYLPLLQGRAKVAAARNQTEAAIRDYTDLVSRVPQPQYLIELGDLYTSLGRAADARASYDLVRAEQKLLTANGVNADLELALFDADHGDAAAALTAARAEWAKRRSIHVADALAWALHRVGRDGEALTYARKATQLGMRSARIYYHLGMIENALGQRTAARADLTRALEFNPHFSTVEAPIARRVLAGLKAAQ